MVFTRVSPFGFCCETVSRPFHRIDRRSPLRPAQSTHFVVERSPDRFTASTEGLLFDRLRIPGASGLRDSRISPLTKRRPSVGAVAWSGDPCHNSKRRAVAWSGDPCRNSTRHWTDRRSPFLRLRCEMVSRPFHRTDRRSPLRQAANPGCLWLAPLSRFAKQSAIHSAPSSFDQSKRRPSASTICSIQSSTATWLSRGRKYLGGAENWRMPASNQLSVQN
jgi:hypothetical protein